MKIVRYAAPLALALTATAACGGGPSPYLSAVSSFAGTTSDGITSLGALPATAASVCRKRAIARYIKPAVMAGQAPAAQWEDDVREQNGALVVVTHGFYSTEKLADGTLSWKDYCNDIQATGTNFSKLLTLLSAYTAALKGLAATGSWDGSDLSAIMNKSAALVGSKTPAGTALSGASTSAQKLGAFVMAKYAADKTHDFASKADESVQAILDALNGYVAAVKRDVVDPSKADRITDVSALEAKAGVWTAPLDEARIVSFTTFAQSVDDDLAAIDAQIAGYTSLIAKIKAGHTTLVSKPQDDSSAKDVISSATDILNALSQLETAIAGSSSK